MSLSRRHFLRTTAGACLAVPALRGRAAAPAPATRRFARLVYPIHPHVQVQPLASRYRHCIHTYPGVDAFDRSGRRLLYIGFDQLDQADIVVRTLADGKERVVGRTNSADYHTAAWQRWVLNDEAILFERRSADGASEYWMVAADGSAPPRQLPALSNFLVRHVIKDGRIAYAETRGGHGTRAHIARIDLRTGHQEVVVDPAPFVAALPPTVERPAGAHYHFSHPVPDDREEWMFVKLMAKVPNEPAIRTLAFFTYHLPTRRVIGHGSTISGHPIWDPVTGQILNIEGVKELRGQNVRRLVLIDPATLVFTEFAPEIIDGPGHPAISPDGRWAATDSFWNDNQALVYLFDRRTGSRWRLATLDHSWAGQKVYNPKVLNRGQPHPVWSPDSRSLVVNCNLGGTRYTLHLLSGFADAG